MSRYQSIPFWYSDSPMIIDLKEFSPDPFYRNTLLSYRDSYGTFHRYYLIKWDKKGIEIWEQIESCFSGSKTPPYRLNWKILEVLSETGEDAQLGNLIIRKDSLSKLLKLKDLDYKNVDDIKDIEKILKG